MTKTLFETFRLFALGGFASLAACQTLSATTGAETSPAVLMNDDAQTMAALKSTLADAMGTARVTLGAGDPTQSSTISVLPPRNVPPQGRSTAMPTLFDLVIEGGQCFVIKRETGAAYPLDGVRCRAVDV